MQYHTMLIIILILNTVSSPLHAADQEQQHNPARVPDPELPELMDNNELPSLQLKPTDWLADYYGLPTDYDGTKRSSFLCDPNGSADSLCSSYEKKIHVLAEEEFIAIKDSHYAQACALALISNNISDATKPIIKRSDRHARNAMNERKDLAMIRFNDMQVNTCALPEYSGPNYSVDPLYKSLARIGSTSSSYQTAISTKYHFQSDGSIKEEETFNGCSHSFHEACLKPGDACAFCGTTMPLAQHIEKKEKDS